MHRRRTLDLRPPRRARGAVALAGILGLGLLAGCGSSDSESTAATPATQASSGGGGAQTVVVGAVPTLELGVLTLGEQQGFFEDEGVELEIANVDSGPNVVTGVVSGQYDVGSTAYAPPLLAAGQGAELQLVSNTSVVGAEGDNTGTLVRKDSGIDGWGDLAGRKIATNAPRSLFALSIPAAVAADGGDPSDVEIVPLPFNAIGKAVADGEVDAGATLQPFLSADLRQHPDLKDLGDSIAEVLPEGSPSGAFFTSAQTASADAQKIEAFKRALQRSVDYADAHLDDAKAAGAPLAGLTPEQAAELPLGPFEAEIAADDLQPLVDLMVEHEWIEQSPDLSAFVG